MLLPSHGIVDFTSTSKAARRGVRYSGVLKSSACKFSDEMMINLSPLTGCALMLSICCFAFLKSKTMTIVFSGISYLIKQQ